MKDGVGKANQPEELEKGALATTLLRANSSGLPCLNEGPLAASFVQIADCSLELKKHFNIPKLKNYS